MSTSNPQTVEHLTLAQATGGLQLRQADTSFGNQMLTAATDGVQTGIYIGVACLVGAGIYHGVRAIGSAVLNSGGSNKPA